MRKIFLISSVSILLMGLAPQLYGETTYFTTLVANYVFENNLHEVVQGRFYRSAEMGKDDLLRTIRANKIKTVIDLRLSEDAPDDSGRTEKTASEAEGAAYFHVPIASTLIAQYAQIEKLLRVYDTAETPILIHCTSGAHRSGVASAIWLLHKENATFDEANKQLSLKYGFLKLERDLRVLAQGKPSVDGILSEYGKASAENGVSFQTWLQTVLDSNPQAAN